jgi:Ca2+-binding EF-hand superfamily protein
MKKLLIGGAALLVSTAALAQVAPVAQTPAAPKAAKAYTRAEVQTKIAEYFTKLDTNRDGSITKAEADAARQASRTKRAEHIKERREDRREHAFERLDSNADGAISRAEWDAAGAQREQRMASRDGNGDGRPDRRNFSRGGMHGMAGLGGHMFDMADGNKDGRVTLQEAQAAANRHFDTADTNRDGQLTREERRQMHQRMLGQNRG